MTKSDWSSDDTSLVESVLHWFINVVSLHSYLSWIFSFVISEERGDASMISKMLLLCWGSKLCCVLMHPPFCSRFRYINHTVSVRGGGGLSDKIKDNKVPTKSKTCFCKETPHHTLFYLLQKRWTGEVKTLPRLRTLNQDRVWRLCEHFCMWLPRSVVSTWSGKSLNLGNSMVSRIVTEQFQISALGN